MGTSDSRQGKESDELQSPPNYLCVTAVKPATIHLINGGKDEQIIIQEAITESWEQGIKDETPQKHGHSWTLQEFPFGYNKQGFYCPAREIRVLSKIIQSLDKNGWLLAGVADLSRRFVFSQWFFIRGSGQHSELDYPCVSLSSVDTILFVNIPSPFYARIKELILKYWDKGIKESKEEENTLELQLKGKPWHGKILSMPARLLMTQLFGLFHRKYNLELYCRLNLRCKADSFLFRPKVKESKDENTFMGICLYGKSGVLIIDAQSEAITIVRKVLQETWMWRGGIKDEKEYVACYGFTLAGSPWWSRKRKQSAMSRLVICRLIEELQSSSWKIITGAAFSKHSMNKDMLVFQKCKPMNVSSMCLCPVGANKLRLVNATSEIFATVRELIQTHWPTRIKRERRYRTPAAFLEFKLNGKPWSGKTTDSFSASNMMCYIMQELQRQGWKLALSADIAAKYMYPGEDDDDDDDDNYAIDVQSLWFVNQSRVASTSGKEDDSLFGEENPSTTFLTETTAVR
ncbi:uncharacterized protein LOC5508265 [Nematostella vectensis]|uniref:uncharacterized protein LOC5508265 n=1 Tax=Nematostella vectensis TaxID=45351 RepID=UPI002076E2CA|nr:uncharacterized protein LOC5508265 [Nematostella vectensis]